MARLIRRQSAKTHLAEVWAASADLRAGMTILDIGAGIGVLTIQYAPIVGPSGLVVAVEPDLDALTRLRAEIVDRGITVVALEGHAEALPPLPRSPDRVLLTDTLHHCANPKVALASIRDVMPPEARLFIAEYDPAGPGAMGAKLPVRIAPEQVTRWLAEAGFAVVAQNHAQDEHYSIIAMPQ